MNCGTEGQAMRDYKEPVKALREADSLSRCGKYEI